MIDLSRVTALTIPEGNVTKIEDSAGNVLWQAGGGGDSYLKTYSFTITATNANGTESRDLSITVQEAV